MVFTLYCIVLYSMVPDYTYWNCTAWYSSTGGKLVRLQEDGPVGDAVPRRRRLRVSEE